MVGLEKVESKVNIDIEHQSQDVVLKWVYYIIRANFP